jgi:hypothetical protein
MCHSSIPTNYHCGSIHTAMATIDQATELAGRYEKPANLPIHKLDRQDPWCTSTDEPRDDRIGPVLLRCMSPLMAQSGHPKALN